jgi:hypothetical protein
VAVATTAAGAGGSEVVLVVELIVLLVDVAEAVEAVEDSLVGSNRVADVVGGIEEEGRADDDDDEKEGRADAEVEEGSEPGGGGNAEVEVELPPYSKADESSEAEGAMDDEKARVPLELDGRLVPAAAVVVDVAKICC